MRKVNILVDYTCDLPDDILEQNNIKAFPLYINIGEKSYRDSIDIKGGDIFKIMEEEKAFPKTSAVGVGEIEEIVNGYSVDEDIIYLGIGSGFSSCYNNARIVAESHPNFYPIDSKNLSTGTGLLVMKAIKFRDQGLSAPEIVEKINDLVPRVRAQFAIDTLRFLHKGGRCSATVLLIGTVLRIKPIIRVINGKMEVTKKPIGPFQKAIEVQISNILEDKDKLDHDCIFITHPDAHQDAIYIRKRLAEVGISANMIIESNASGVISTHCGPRTIGILYIVNE